MTSEHNIDSLEWDESDLYNAPEESFVELPHEECTDEPDPDSGASSDIEFVESPGRAVPINGGMPVVGQQSESSKSTSLLVTVDDYGTGEYGQDADTLGSLRGRPSREHFAAIPVRMGTSAPINIPFLGRWKKEDPSVAEEVPEHPAEFVPPHQLSQKDHFMSLSGLSPNASLKREKLRARNAILRKTGFLETNNPAGDMHELQERSRITGGLSQAFSVTGGP